MEPSKRNRTAGARRQRNKTVFATSCKAIGWASMLFAVSSSVHAFPVGTRTELLQTEFRIPSWRSRATRNLALCRKDSTGHSELQPTLCPASAMMRSTSTSNTQLRSCLPRTLSTRRYATRLHYSDYDHDAEPERRRRVQETSTSSRRRTGQEEADDDSQDQEAAAKWWKSVFQQQPPAPSSTQHHHHVDEEQQVVDEYLEFLDKRYKRLHEDDHKTNNRPRPAATKPFSALSWLAGGGSDKTDPISQQQQEDALYVLGVAELASERLLQKHHAHLQYKQRRTTPVSQGDKHKQEVVIDAVAKEDPSISEEEEQNQDKAVVTARDKSSQTRLPLMVATLGQVGRRLLKGTSERRRALISFQDRKIVDATTLAIKALLSLPTRAIQLFWKLGGGKKTIAITVSAFLTVFLVIRPVAEAVVSEATLSST